MAIVRFNPVNEMFNLQREMNRLFESFGTARKGGEEMESAVWRPMVDVHEDEGSYLIDVELPGLSKEDVKINYQDGTLTIAGERKYTKESGSPNAVEASANGNGDGQTPAQKPLNVHRMERFYGRFFRSFSFPTAVNPDRISAGFKDGILSVTVPKAEEVKPRQISIED